MLQALAAILRRRSENIPVFRLHAQAFAKAESRRDD
jgi:hypothetical protein